MSDLIDRQEAIDRFNVIRPVDPKKDEYTKGIDVGIAMCIVAVKDQPTAQPEKAQLSSEDATSDQPVATDTNVGDTISRQAVLDAIVQCTNCGDEDTLREYVLKHSLDNGWTGGILEALDAVKDLPTIQPEKAQLSKECTTSDLISKFIDDLEEIFAHIREKHVDDSVCGLCEYDGAYIGQSGDWCNECPGFDRDDCFKLSDKTRKEWTDEIIKALPTAQPEPKEGHWIRTDCGLDVECKCSKCGYRDFVEPHDTYWFKRNYCPNCGAKMINK